MDRVFFITEGSINLIWKNYKRGNVNERKEMHWALARGLESKRIKLSFKLGEIWENDKRFERRRRENQIRRIKKIIGKR